jgi:hypothetical protein
MTNQVDNIQAEACNKLNHLNAKLYINYKHKYTHSPSGTMSGRCARTLRSIMALSIADGRPDQSCQNGTQPRHLCHFGTFRPSLMGSIRNKTHRVNLECDAACWPHAHRQAVFCQLARCTTANTSSVFRPQPLLTPLSVRDFCEISPEPRTDLI